MKMFKKIMAVALVGVMALSMLTGCAITDAIIEDKAEAALENAWRTEQDVTIDFKSGSFNNADVKAIKTDIESGNITVADGATVVKKVTTGNEKYTVVVVAQPKNAKKVENWKNLAKKVLVAADWKTGIYTTGTNSLKAKVDITAGIEGKDAADKDVKDTYAMFVFAANDVAYNK